MTNHRIFGRLTVIWLTVGRYYVTDIIGMGEEAGYWTTSAAGLLDSRTEATA